MVGSTRRVSENDQNDVDFILNDIGGTFNRFQISNYLMLSFTMFVSGVYVLDYVFATLEIDHRCAIVECDSSDATTFKPDWLIYSVPFKNDQPDSCHRFESMVEAQPYEYDMCVIDSFNRSKIADCGNGPMIFRTDEVSIVNEFNLTCDENRWKVAMVGTYSNIGRLLFLPIGGYLSDRIGRKRILVGSILLGSAIKVVKSFATGYNMFVILEMFDAGVISALYPTALILAIEWSMTQRKILVTSLVLAPYSLGQVVTAIIASYLHNYKWMLQVISVFGFITIPFIWMLPESLRWLLVNRKYKQAINVVEKAAKMNGIELSPQSHEIIASKCKDCNTDDESNHNENNGSFMDIVRSCPLFTRLMTCAFCWVSSTFISYGVSIISVSLPGDKYVNFIVVSLGAMPSIFLTYVMLRYMSRRWSISASLCITAISILASKFFSSNATLSLIFFFMGKLFIQHSFVSLYLYTSEMWPTVLRHSAMGFCSTIGRFGSIAAPLAPLLISVMELLPFYLFSGFAFLSAVVILFLPETFKQKKLPDSISDIKNFNK